MKLKKPRWFISLYTGWLQNIYVLGLQYEKRHITLETLRINFASLYHGQIIKTIALASKWQGRIQGEGAGGAHPPPPWDDLRPLSN